MVLNLDRRCSRLLDLLQMQEDYETIDSLSVELGQTRRNTQYDLCKINDAFSMVGLPAVISRRNKGIRLLEEQKLWWEHFSTEHRGKYNYVFTQDERVSVIICGSMLSKDVNTIDEMAEMLKVSRNTVILDMKTVKERLWDYGIEVQYLSKYGYTIKGDGLRIRSVFLYYTSLLYPLITDGVLPYLDDPEVQRHRERLNEIQQALRVDYQPKTIHLVAIMLSLLKRNIPLEISDEDNSICDKNTFKTVSSYYPELSMVDKLYVSIQLLGARLRNGYYAPDERTAQYMELAEKLLCHFERFAAIEVENRDQLIYILAKHLNHSVYRYRFGLSDTFNLEAEMQSNPRELYELVKLAANEFSKDIGFPINDPETAFLTVHFAAHMRHNASAFGKAKAVIVDAAADSGCRLADKVEFAFPMLHTVGVITPGELDSFPHPYNIVISTQLLKYDGFYAYVSGALTSVDQKKILEVYLRYRKLKNENMGESLFSSIQQYIPKENHQRVKEEIGRYFDAPVPNLLQLIDKGSVQCIDSIFNWRDALAQAALPLIQSGSIETSYVDTMITDIEMHGCSTYLGNGVYLAHTKSQGNVRRSAVAILTIKKGVVVRNSPRVHFLIAVASTDQNEHFTVLREAVKLCTDEERMKQMLACESDKELYQVIEQFAREGSGN